MARASRTDASTGRPRQPCSSSLLTRSRSGATPSALGCTSAPPDRTIAGGVRLSHPARFPRRLAAAADALDLLVERLIFLAEGIVRVAQVLLAGHIGDARLAVAHGCQRRRSRGRAPGCRSLGAAGLRNRGAAEQDHQRYCHHDLLHVSPSIPQASNSITTIQVSGG